MTDLDEKLSAYLDGELSEAESAALEAQIAENPDLRAVLDALTQADAMAVMGFDAVLDEPVPLGMAAAIRDAAVMPVANDITPPRRGWQGLAAACALFLVLGIGGGYFVGAERSGDATGVVLAGGWLDDVMGYHGIYAAESRHLVEVPASDSEHLQKWLNNVVGTAVTIPALDDAGLTFQGGRLLAASGKPVGQLMYTDASGNVVALCFIQSGAPQDGFVDNTRNGFDLVSWGGAQTNFVVIGPEGYDGLHAVAQDAALQV